MRRVGQAFISRPLNSLRTFGYLRPQPAHTALPRLIPSAAICQSYATSLHYTSQSIPSHQVLSGRSLSLRQMSTNAESKYEDFFRYTTGRWLWDEEEQLRERYITFNVTELQRVAAESVGARSCTNMVKLAEGSFNKVFRLLMDNGKAVIARIPHPNAGPERYNTASEVATMDFVWIPNVEIESCKVSHDIRITDRTLGSNDPRDTRSRSLHLECQRQEPRWGRIYHHGRS
jgi:hypothetical protein